MLFFLLSFVSLLIFFSKSLPSQPLPSWATEMRLLSLLFCKEFLFLSVHWLRSGARLLLPMATTAALLQHHRKMVPTARKQQLARESEAAAGNNAEEEASTILDLPELALDCILGRLSPAELCVMACVCSSLRERCTSGYVWERHMREKWGRVIGAAAREEWRWHVASKGGGVGGDGKAIVLLPCTWPLSWIRSKLSRGSRCSSSPVEDSVMSWYLALEGGKFSFPAQVYNRENGHVGFMLSCYDAELTYDRETDTFRAKYPPHGRRTIVVEDGVNWDRVRAPPTDTSAHDLHVSDCLSDLRPGDHIEIQWRRNKEFPYGWWYGTVGHLESCDGSELYCRCHCSGTVVLEFNQYAPGSRWRRSAINRRDHREEGNESDGFYGGIRKLRTKDEIDLCLDNTLAASSLGLVVDIFQRRRSPFYLSLSLRGGGSAGAESTVHEAPPTTMTSKQERT